MLDPHPLGMLERAGLRKAALDAGFDVLTDGPNCVFGSSSHAPLACVVGRLADGGGYGAGLSMASVLGVLSPDAGAALVVAVGASGVQGLAMSSAVAGWRQVADFSALERLLAQAWALSRALPNELARRFERAVAEISATERESTVRQRIGQGLFRQGLITLWGGRCAISGLSVPELLRASHAKPWAEATDAERLDVFNGLLLAAHLDAAFDAGLISVAPNGVVMTSPAMPAEAARVLGLGAPQRIELQASHLPYMRWHDEHVFRRWALIDDPVNT